MSSGSAISKYAGKFIVFDGIDGCGKDTVRDGIAKRIEATGTSVVMLSDPGGTGVCNEIRRMLKTQREDGEDLDSWTELLLFVAARAQLLRKRIIPALLDGLCVLCTRWVYSTYAYQGAGKGHDRGVLEFLHKAACGNAMPNLAVFFDLKPDEARIRCSARERGVVDRFEKLFTDVAPGIYPVYSHIRDSYLMQAELNAVSCQWDATGKRANKVAVIDASLPADVVLEKTWALLEEEFINA